MTALAAITGVGYSSEFGRGSGRTEGQLALEACRAALADARLPAEAVDGLSMYPVRTSPPNAFQGPPLDYVHRSLAMGELAWCQSFAGENGQLGAIVGSVDALRAGRCHHVLCYRAHRAQDRPYIAGGADPTAAYDEDEHTMAYGAGGGSARGALWAARYMHEYGVAQVELGAVAVNGRQYGATNPRAYWKTPITIDEYLDSRWIATPLKLFDVDYPIDAATAFVLSTIDGASRTRKPVWIEAMSTGPGLATSWATWPDLSTMASSQAARALWPQTSVRPADVDVAELYDGFSFFTLMWLEDLGFVEHGAAGRWLLEGGGLPGGSLAVNTDGGQLGSGRLHGFGKLAQAVLQVRGEAPNQVDDAAIAVAAAGGGPLASALIVTAEPG